MIVDCVTCPVRGQRCGECAVTVLGASGSGEHRVSTGHLGLPGLAPSSARQSTELRLDPAEKRVVSMFVGAGLVSAGAVATLCARPESVQHRGSARHVG
jgi:hypothetical protein